MIICVIHVMYKLLHLTVFDGCLTSLTALHTLSYSSVLFQCVKPVSYHCCKFHILHLQCQLPSQWSVVISVAGCSLVSGQRLTGPHAILRLIAVASNELPSSFM